MPAGREETPASEEAESALLRQKTFFQFVKSNTRPAGQLFRHLETFS